MNEAYDCVIIGGGPAGLSAAIYLARYRRRVLLIDKGESRAATIPRSHNVPGYPDGVVGIDLLKNMAVQAAQYGAVLKAGCVTEIVRDDDGFTVTLKRGGTVSARTVLIATGVVNRRPPLEAAVHDAAVAAGRLRYCPVCDGWEAGGWEAGGWKAGGSDSETGGRQAIAVLGADGCGVAEALFLKAYSDHVTLLTLVTFELDETDRANLEKAGIDWESRAASGFEFDDAVRVTLEDGEVLTFDTLYPALGSKANAELIEALGLTLDNERCILTDEHRRLKLKGLYAAGDIVSALDQIAVAMGHAAIAATAIHNDLRDADGETAKP